MLALKVPLKDAEKWKDYLLKSDLFSHGYILIKDDEFIYFPIRRRFDIIKGKVEFVGRDFKALVQRSGLKEKLSEKLSERELSVLQTAHDIIGNIAILEIPHELEGKEKIIAEALLKTNPFIKTVLKKAASHEGTYRTQKMKYLAGERKKEALYKENNVVMKLDVEKVYFSVRLSNERKRISGLVKPGEDILVMFSGCAPYPLVLSKNTRAKHITGIEINPIAHRYALKNIQLNNIKNIELFLGDVKKIIPKLKKLNKKYDRIIMPLPKSAEEFLEEALIVAKKGTIIHFYDFLEEGKFGEAKKKIDKACKKHKMKYKILQTVKCGQHAPYVFRICVDFGIL